MTAIGRSDIMPVEMLDKALGLFLGLLIVFGSLATLAMVKLGTNYSWSMVLMWTPAMSAFITCKILKINFNILGWKWGETRWMVWSYVTPLVYLGIAYLSLIALGYASYDPSKFIEKSADWMGLSGWSNGSIIFVSTMWLLVFAVINAMARALGEEIGWRGFLTPLLARKFSFPVMAFITGLIWAMWHVPLLIYSNYIAEYGYGMELWINILNYMIMTIALAFPMAYLRLKSGSLWTGTLFHAVHNIIFGAIAIRMLVPVETSKLQLSEFGYAIPAVAVITAIYFWRRAISEGLNGPLNA